MELSVCADVLFLEQAAYLLQPLLEARAALIHRYAETGELVRQKRPGKADFQATAGNGVDHADLAGKLEWIVEHRQHCTGDQPDRPGDCGCRAQEYQRIGAIAAI